MVVTVDNLTINTPKILVGCLAAHNSGKSHKKWFKANQYVEGSEPLEYLKFEIKEFLKSSPEENANEWVVLGYDSFGCFGNYLGEFPSLEDVSQAADFFLEYGKLAEILLDRCKTLKSAIAFVEERYEGCYESIGKYAEQYLKSFNTVSKELEYYINWEEAGRKMEMEGFIFSVVTDPRTVHVFSASDHSTYQKKVL